MESIVVGDEELRKMQQTLIAEMKVLTIKYIINVIFRITKIS